MTCRVEGGVTFKQTYNAENRISTIQKLASGTCASPGNLTAHWAFAYDGDGTRVSTLYTPYVGGAPQTSVLTAYYMGGAYEVTGSAVKKYYSVAGMMVAMNDGSGLQYLLTDHLGSTIAVTNSSGTLTSQQRYLPFGAPRTIPNSPILGTDFTYTGQRKLDDGMGGIMDYKARFYSPYINRFLQPDSIIPNPANPQNFNRFSYVLNNPIRFNDPTGHVCSDPEDPTPTCYGSGTTRVGDRIIQGNHAELGAAKTLSKEPNGGGGNNDCAICDLIGGANDILQALFGGHQYGVLPSPVCLPLPWINCTDSETDNYLAGNQYPGQLPWQPVQSGGQYNVFPEKFGDIDLLGRWFPGSGAINVVIEGNTITNVARPTHIFYTGYVGRTSFEGPFGMTYVTTYGEGYNDGFELGDYTVPGWVIDQANNVVGPIAFTGLNLQLITYTTWVETGQALTRTQQP